MPQTQHKFQCATCPVITAQYLYIYSPVNFMEKPTMKIQTEWETHV